MATETQTPAEVAAKLTKAQQRLLRACDEWERGYDAWRTAGTPRGTDFDLGRTYICCGSEINVSRRLAALGCVRLPPGPVACHDIKTTSFGREVAAHLQNG